MSNSTCSEEKNLANFMKNNRTSNLLVPSNCLMISGYFCTSINFVTKSPLVDFDVPNSIVRNKLLTMCKYTYTFHMQFN